MSYLIIIDDKTKVYGGVGALGSAQCFTCWFHTCQTYVRIVCSPEGLWSMYLRFTKQVYHPLNLQVQC